MSILGVLRTGRTPGRGDAHGPCVEALRSASRNAAHQGRRRQRRRLLGAHHLLPRPRHSGGQRIQDPHGLPSAGSRRSARRLPGRQSRARHHRRAQEVHHHPARAHITGSTSAREPSRKMLENPGVEIFDVIRYFGTRKKIFNVHFRNIRGHRNDFDGGLSRRRRHRFREGDPASTRRSAILTCSCPIMCRSRQNDPGSLQSFAFCYGYIRALIQSVNDEA